MPTGSTEDPRARLRVNIGDMHELTDLVARWWAAVWQRWNLTRKRAEANFIRIEGADFNYDSVNVKFTVTGEVRIFVHGVEANQGLSGLLTTPGFSWKHLDKMREDISTFVESVWKKTTEETDVRREYLKAMKNTHKFVEDIGEWEIIKD